jgi:urease accessory protein
MNQLYGSALLVMGLVLSNVVHAHIGGHGHQSFEAGLLHPFSGFDHMLAMIAIGVWAAQCGGRSMLAVPAAFVAAMAAGAAIGMGGGFLPFAEGTIGVSVLVLGALVAFAVRGAWQIAAALAGLFALFHGYVHGTGMPEFSSTWSYLAGILMATASLHAFGVAFALMFSDKSKFVRAGGAAITIAGACLLVAA